MVGNQIDREDREVTREEAVVFANNNNLKYFETSAKENIRIKETFYNMYKDIYEVNKSNTNDELDLSSKKKISNKKKGFALFKRVKENKNNIDDKNNKKTELYNYNNGNNGKEKKNKKK